MENHKVYAMSFSKVYPLLVAKAERKGRTKKEVDAVIKWLTGYTQEKLDEQLSQHVSYEVFFNQAPELNPMRNQITGSICGVKIHEIEEPLMKEIRYLDKLIDELAKGKSLEKLLK